MFDELNYLLRRKEIMRTLGAVLGGLIFAVGVNLFIVPVGVYNGGIMGICQILRTVLIRYLHISFNGFDFAGIIYYVLNIPLFFLAYKTMGKLFFGKTMICMAAMTVFLTLIPVPSALIIRNDTLTNCIIGGILSGIGGGFTLMMGGSGGGMDIIGLYYVKSRRRSGVGQVTLAVNVVLYTVCFLMFDITTAVYSFIVAVVSTVAVDKIHSQNINVEVIVISKKDLSQLHTDILQQLGRGITKWNVTGAYTNGESELLYVILSKYEVTQLKHMVHSYDQDAFIVAKEGVNVDGNFQKRL